MLHCRLGSWGLFCKTLQIPNLREIHKFCGKLASSSLVKHTICDRQKHYLTTESVHYKSNIFIVQDPGLSNKLKNRLEKPGMNKRPSLSGPFVTKKEKKVVWARSQNGDRKKLSQIF